MEVKPYRCHSRGYLSLLLSVTQELLEVPVTVLLLQPSQAGGATRPCLQRPWGLGSATAAARPAVTLSWGGAGERSGPPGRQRAHRGRGGRMDLRRRRWGDARGGQ